MKLTPSSSLLLATLAISSSSSTLAAPADHAALEQSSYSSSSSIRSLAMLARDDQVDLRDRGDANSAHSDPPPVVDVNLHIDRERRDLAATLSSILGPLLDPVVPLLQPLLQVIGLKLTAASSAESIASLDTHTVDGIAAALTNAQKVIEALPGGSAHRRDVADDSASTSSSTLLSSSISPASTASTSTTTSRNSTVPTSPSLPANPPNSPVPGPAAPKPPVPRGAYVPSGPIARNAPPMFPDFAVADVNSTSSSITPATTPGPVSPGCGSMTGDVANATSSTGCVSSSASSAAYSSSGSASDTTAVVTSSPSASSTPTPSTSA